jgi:hypothetical protein
LVSTFSSGPDDRNVSVIAFSTSWRAIPAALAYPSGLPWSMRTTWAKFFFRTHQRVPAHARSS